MTPEAYSESCQTSKMECFAKIVNYFRKTFHLRCLRGFLIRLSTQIFVQNSPKYSLKNYPPKFSDCHASNGIR